MSRFTYIQIKEYYEFLELLNVPQSLCVTVADTVHKVASTSRATSWNTKRSKTMDIWHY